jgi:murein L,D-transpeptidase YafK
MIGRAILALGLIVAGGAAMSLSGADRAGECLAHQYMASDGRCTSEIVTVDRIVIDKSDRRMWAYANGQPIRAFDIALGRDPVSDKERQGDNRTPEGVYPVTAHNPESAFHLSLRLGYPTPEQSAAAEAAGIDPGGDIMIHGLPDGQAFIGRAHLARNWTEGCIAVTNEEVEWLYEAVEVGTPVEIRA